MKPLFRSLAPPRAIALIAGATIGWFFSASVPWAGEDVGDAEMSPPPPGSLELHAQGMFFADTIEINAWVGEAFGPRSDTPGAERGGGPRREGGRGGGPPPDGPPPGGVHAGRAAMRMAGPGGGGGEGMPKRIRLEITNHGSETASLEVIDFKSAFGNFAVRPRTIRIEPGQTAVAEPMLSRLELYADQLPLQMRIIRGDVSEEQILRFEPAAMPPAEARSAPEAAADAIEGNTAAVEPAAVEWGLPPTA